MKITGGMVWAHTYTPGAVRDKIHAVLLYIFPGPGTNRLAHNTVAAGRTSAELVKIREVLRSADVAEQMIRNRIAMQHRSAGSVFGALDPEANAILTNLANVRRALTPWAAPGWCSINEGHDEKEEK